jgi:hypothetical protein
MITLVCTKCATTLSVDDGFAGGVCRCSKCGTIQTVPSQAAARSGLAGGVSGQSIYERRDRTNADGTSPDLQTLSDIVTSSGLGGSGMLGQGRHRGIGVATPVESTRWQIIAGASLAMLLVGAAAVLVWSRSMSGDADVRAESVQRPALGQPAGPALSGADPAEPTIANVPVGIAGPSFGPIALDRGGTVVYLVDRGAATQAYTAPLRASVLKSVRSLGENRKFQVRFWSAFGESPAFPSAPADASPANFAKLEAWMADITGGQATDAISSLDAALSLKPAEIVLVTGKAWQLDEGFASEAIVKLSESKGVRLHGVSLGAPSTSDALSRVVSRAGGQYAELSEGQLEALAR